MQRLANEQRFEEAAAVRDRHRALARALQRRRAWQALQEAGTIEVEGADGDRAVIRHGRLLHAWKTASHPPLVATPSEAATPSFPVPGDVLAAEEAHLLWRWMTGPGSRLIHAEGSLVLPAAPVRSLAG